ncbi:phenylalanine--tRNA ligase subunit beta [Enterococcus sp. DIV0242_7C1]|uniref:Phenylalanine--tRNA ligase beta subunit n=1 Tax=Candidatus Enterococcus dunnyi TaxID=1834192 RepID=A0A200JEG7_9ENTE|nr:MULTISPECIES: phenylalanine--tRNA ligase subunit beta [unclassified Enterococcus]MBO0469138.1 phenylalanine--tRNA ligase subunit beta [Enterococcus sp. DIV0242_7C1]OUZ35568.1 phenylalanine-tRNA ligase beta subunit [Enterococcus sp. 9D6_DIV0238]
MLVSYKWLSEYLDLSKISAKELSDKMSVTGIEVEGVEVPEDGLKKIVVGEVKECIPHPNSDHLSICQVDIGEEELSQIVCGAPNVKAGIKVIVALPGSRITGNQKIKKGKMRGEVSNGMICSLQELGYSDNVIPKAYSDGIYYLPDEAVNGTDVFPYLDMDDHIIELSITPNRADALSMRGVAYEVGAIYRQTPSFNDEPLMEDMSETASDYIDVEVMDTKDAPAYQIRIIKDVKIAESPLWLQNRLMNEGIRPINNVVDVTNYILLLFGQPLHAFDYDKLNSKKILVRRGNKGEELVTLDGEKRELSSENIVITNGDIPVALAGVMGGADSEITDGTTTVALESALFDSLSIRRTSKEFNLRSESSSRFEKGINQATVGEAGDVAAAMIAKLAGGTVVSGKSVGSKVTLEEVNVSVTIDRINEYLGTTLNEAIISEIFEALGFNYSFNNGEYTVTVPPRRWDISIEADLIEEVARIYGYDNLPSTLPKGETVAGSLTDSQQLVRKIKGLLEGSGLSEAISYALTTEEKSSQFMMRSSEATKLQWPMSEERSTLRMNLISGLLDDVLYNTARKNSNVGLYEIGRVFYKNEDEAQELPYEENHLAVAISGNQTIKDWQTKETPVDFYTVKGILEGMFDSIGLKDVVTYEAVNDYAEMHPGRTALVKIDEKVIGFVGQVHPTIAKEYDIPETYVAELNLQAIVEVSGHSFVYQQVTKFPAISRDIALLVDETVTNQALVETITMNAGKYLQSVHLFDVYQGANIADGKKSMAYSLTFVNSEATLVDEEINQSLTKVEKALVEQFDVSIR